jgi:hypothetical protein
MNAPGTTISVARRMAASFPLHGGDSRLASAAATWLHERSHIWLSAGCRAMRDLIDGRLEEVEQLGRPVQLRYGSSGSPPKRS